MNLSCPIPNFDFDTINLGHGSGGVLTHQLLNSGVFSILQNDLLNEKHDGAVFNLQGKTAFSTDSYVVNPIFFPGGNIGELAVNGTVNDLAMCGAMAKYLSLSFIIEEGLPVKDFLEILLSIKESCTRANVMVVTGDTKVVEKGKGDKIFINTSGIGLVNEKAVISMSSINTGDVIIVSGNIAEHGIAIMSKRTGLEFETDILSDTTNLNFTVEKLLNQFGNGIHFLRDATRGGLASVLNEVAKGGMKGIDILQKNIPVQEQVNGACEMLGLDPLYVANEGRFITIVDRRIAPDVLSLLREDENGSNASVIGNIVDDHAGQVIMQSTIGGKRVVNMLPGEQLPRIC
ncbi:MAG: hydrogenase expression/formation protein HypE [Ferruginibacter sp.]